MKTIGVLLVFLLVACSFSTSAKVHVRIDEKTSAKQATHIVIASEGKAIDGHLEVIESWKGDLGPGDTLFIPELASLEPPKSRRVRSLYPVDMGIYNPPDEYITCSRMILFLRKNAEEENERGRNRTIGSQTWSGIDELSVVQSAIFIEGNQCYAFWDCTKEDRGILSYLEGDERTLRERITAALEKER